MLSTANDKAPLSCSIYTKETEKLILGGVMTFSTDETEALKHKRASLRSLLHSNWMTHLTHSKQVFLYQRDLIFWTPCYEKAVYVWCMLMLLLLLLRNVLDQLTTYSFLFLQQLFLLFVRMLEYK